MGNFQVVIVTGAASGIGKACAELFAARGAHVAIFDIDAQNGEQTARTICATGAVARFVGVNIAEEAQITAAVRLVAESFGGIDVLVNCAAVQVMAGVHETSVEQLDLLYRVNLRGPFLTSRECLPYLAQSTAAAIVNIGSVLGLVGDPMLAGYGAMKGALIALTKSLAIAWGPQKIRVNCVCPGDVRTRMVEEYFSSGPSSQTESAINAAYALGRIAEPQEIAELACFLASPNASFLTGSVVVIDGGLTSKCY